MSPISSGLPLSSSSLLLRNITIDDNDSSLRYSQGWSRSLLSNAVGGSLQIADGVGDMVQFDLPNNSVALYYIGLAQTEGALYGVCMDCNSADSGSLENFSAHSKVQPTETSVLFSRTGLDPNVPHSFTLVNFPDNGFGGKSTITVDAFIVTVQEEASSTSSDVSSSSVSLETTSISMPSMAIPPMTELTQSSTTANDPAPIPTDDSPPPPPPPAQATSTSTSSTQSPSSTAGRSQNDLNANSGSLHIGAIRSPVALGGLLVLMIVAAGMALFALMYFMRRRKRRTKSPFVQIRVPEVEKFIEKNEKSGGSGTMARVAPGAMVEQLVPDRPRPGGNVGGYHPAGPAGRGRPGAGPGRYNPARRSFVDRLPSRVSQFVPRTAPRALFAGGASARRPNPPVAYSSPLRNELKPSAVSEDAGLGALGQDPFADANPFENAEREAWMRQNGAREPVVAGHRRPEPAFRLPDAAGTPNMRAPSPSDDPFAYAEMEAHRQMALQASMGQDKHTSVVSQYSQAGHEDHPLPTPWLQGTKVQKPWELV